MTDIYRETAEKIIKPLRWRFATSGDYVAAVEETETILRASGLRDAVLEEAAGVADQHLQGKSDGDLYGRGYIDCANDIRREVRALKSAPAGESEGGDVSELFDAIKSNPLVSEVDLAPPAPSDEVARWNEPVVKCEDCIGLGFIAISGANCKACGGSGLVPEERPPQPDTAPPPTVSDAVEVRGFVVNLKGKWEVLLGNRDRDVEQTHELMQWHIDEGRQAHSVTLRIPKPRLQEIPATVVATAHEGVAK